MSTSRPYCGQKVYVNKKFKWHHRERSGRKWDDACSLQTSRKCMTLLRGIYMPYSRRVLYAREIL
jgi:hypothetical protein